jgi:hypothetical protein
MVTSIMLDDTYLIMGLDGMSRAHEGNYFRDGHLGASVIAAYYLCHENNLDERTQNAIKSHIDRDLRNEATFLPAPHESANPLLLDQLLNTLSDGIEDLREVGHNIIFGAAALKAFRECPEAITPFRVDGICRLIEDFDSTQNVNLGKDDDIPSIENESALIAFIFSEYLRSVSLYAGYGQGWAGHLLTIGHAVIELSRLGHPELALKAHKAYRMYIKTMRRGPKETDRLIPDHRPTELTPLDEKYWAQRKSVVSGIGHAFKYAYSFYNLLAGLNNQHLKKRCTEQSYLIL